VYDNFPSILKALRLRYALAPYIYTNAHYAYETGISLCCPLYYDYPYNYPEENKAYEIEDEYMFGKYQCDATRKILIVELSMQACTQKIELKVVP
jgi:hypothetical protein